MTGVLSSGVELLLGSWRLISRFVGKCRNLKLIWWFCGFCFPWHIKQVTSVTGKSTHVGESTKASLNLFASVCYCYLSSAILLSVVCVIEASFFASYLYLLIIYFKLL